MIIVFWWWGRFSLEGRILLGVSRRKQRENADLLAVGASEKIRNLLYTEVLLIRFELFLGQMASDDGVKFGAVDGFVSAWFTRPLGGGRSASRSAGRPTRATSLETHSWT